MQSSVERLGEVVKERYLIDRELGRGGMAIVYLARDVRDNRLVAIKVLLPDLAMAVGPDRFRREIDLASRFSHPHILPLYDSGEADGLLYYVMPYVEGESVRARLDREGPLPVEDAVRIAMEVAQALAYAHAQNVVHRDIKPENILLEDGHALVADFGIARAVAAAGDQKLTQTGVALGTPQYMSPEQGSADRRLDGRSDIYSLGCVLYEMLAGQAPFAGANAQAIIMRHAIDQAPPLTTVRRTVPPELELVVMRSLAKVPADRFQTAEAFADALRSPAAATATWTMATPSATLTTPPLPRAPRRMRRYAWMAAAVAIPVVVGAGWAAWTHWHTSARVATTTSGLDPRHIAVLYFDDASSSHDLGYLAAGLTETLIDQLGDVRNLTVVSPAGVAPYRGGGVAPDSIARAVQAGTIVRGSVEHDGDRLRVAVRLVDGASGADYQRASFEQPANRVLVLRDTLAADVASMIRARLGEEVKLRAQREGTTNAAAWAVLQQGQEAKRRGEALMRSPDTAGLLRNFHAADSLFAVAATLDPRWPEPDILRGGVDYKASRFFGDDPIRASPWIDTGLVRVEHALALDPKSPDGLELRGTLRYWHWLLNLDPDPKAAKQSLAAAQQDLEAATRIRPEQAGAWAVLSHLYYQVDDIDGAKIAARRAYEEDAYLANADLVLWRLFTTSYDLESFTEAVHWCDVGMHRFPADPHFAECRLHLMATKAVAPDVPRALRVADSLVALTAEPSRAYAAIEGRILAAAAIARAGYVDSARHMLSRANATSDIDPTRDLEEYSGFAWNLLGDRERALRSLKIYLAANPSRARDFDAGRDWRWRNLQNDPRFQALVTATEPAR